MKNQFVTYEIALKLKELGFNKPCIAKYCRYNPSDDIKLFPQSQNFFKGDGFEYCKNNEYKKEEKTAAPLWQQAIDWCFTQLDFYYPTLRLTVYSDESGEWLQTKDDGIDRVSIDFDNKKEMVLKVIELIKEK